MAVTQGHGNPDWSRDETILALDLYLKSANQVPGPADPRVIELSKKLRALPIHVGATKRDSFRNPAGVAFKLQNLRQVATGNGLANVSSIDRKVWHDFGGKPDVVNDLATRICMGAAGDNITAEEVSYIDADEEFVEGKVITAMHRARERNPKVRAKLIQARIASGQLSCDACDEGPKSHDHALAAAGYETHHKIPLATTVARSTKLADVALLCATCHRLIHRAMHHHRQWLSVPAFRQLLIHHSEKL